MATVKIVVLEGIVMSSKLGKAVKPAMAKLVKESYDLLEKKFDARDWLYELLELYFNKYGNIPSKHLASWNTYQQDKKKWRDIPGMKKKLWKIAKLNAKIMLKSKDQKDKMAEAYLDKQLKKINRRVAK